MLKFDKSVLRKNLYKCIVVLVLIGHILSSVSAIINMFLISQNTIFLGSNTDKVKVVNISIDDTIYLDDGRSIEGNDIKNYLKVSKGSGTWYLNENSSLSVEITNKDVLGFLGLNIIYMLLLSFFVIRWLKKGESKRYIKVLVSCTYGIYLFLFYTAIWGYLDIILSV